MILVVGVPAIVGKELEKGFTGCYKKVREGTFPDGSIHAYKIRQEETDRRNEILE